MLTIFTFMSYFLIAVLLMNMFAKARPKIKEATPGKTLLSVPMNFLSRFQLQRSSLLALLMGLAFGTATGWLSLSTAGIVGSLALLTILIPMKYTFTTKGIALGDGIFYPWNEFSGFVAREKSLRLASPSLFGRLTLFVKPADMTSVLQYVEQYVNVNR